MIPRHLAPAVEAALTESRVVFVQGARQVGKTTLVRALAGRAARMEYRTLDDATTFAAASTDAEGFVAGLRSPTIIDEVQRAPPLFTAIKKAVDLDAQAGRFLLTGSAGVFVLPRLSDALVGRMQILTLHPFSQDELAKKPISLVDTLFARTFDAEPGRAPGRAALWGRVLRGGFPEACRRRDARSRAAFFDGYVTTVAQRDVRDLASIQGASEVPRLLGALLARSATILNMAEVARDLALPQTTLKRYLSLLEGSFLVHRIPAWSANLGQRLVKAPKLLPGDTGLAAGLLGLGDADHVEPGPLSGRLLESFVGLELLKQLGWSEIPVRLHHFRDHSGNEVDWILEDARGRVVGVEVKAASSVGPRDWRGLRHLAEGLGTRFQRGVILYAGSQVVPLTRRILALPVHALWSD